MKANTLLYAVPLLLLLAACGTVQPDPSIGGSPSLDITTLALDPTTIDFESGFTAGDTVDFVTATMGMSGADAGGFVTVTGSNPNLGAANAAMIFDATCGGAPGGCSGDDADLFNPSLGNVLIVSEDLDANDPDDADVDGTTLTFDFSTWGDGTVAIGMLSATMFDTNDIDGGIGDESGSHVRLYDHSDAMLAEYPLLATGDGGSGSVEALINYEGVARMTVELMGSGAIDNITLATDFPEGGEGCYIPYWRNRSNHGQWVGYSPSDSFDEVFDVTSSDGDTLLSALPYNGGGEQALQRQAVAALLNATSGIDFRYTRSDVMALVQEAYGSGQWAGIKNLLKRENRMFCPFVDDVQPAIGGF
jgi:hypothetical protein